MSKKKYTQSAAPAKPAYSDKMQEAIKEVNENKETLYHLVDAAIDNNSDMIIKYLAAYMSWKYFASRSPLKHYEHEYDGNPYDFSGILVEDGKIGQLLTTLKGREQLTVVKLLCRNNSFREGT